MATSVQIELTVDDKGAVQGFRSIDGAAKNTSGAVNQLDSAVQKLDSHVKKVGPTSQKAMHEMSEHSLTALDNVRLLRDDLGIFLPRSIEKAIATSKGLMSAIGAVGTGILAVGAIKIGIDVVAGAIEGAKKLYDEYLNVNKVVKEYQVEARKAAAIKLFDEGALQTQISMMQDVNREFDQLTEKKRTASGTGNFFASLLGGSNFAYFSPNDQKRLNELTSQEDKAAYAGIEKERQNRLRQLQNREDLAKAGKSDAAQAEIEKNYSYQRADLEQTYQQRKDALTVGIYNRGLPLKDQKQLPGDDGWQERLEARQSADVKAEAARIERAKSTADEIRRIEAEAEQAQLGGVQLLEAQRRQAESDWIREHGASTAAIRAIDEKFYAQEAKLIRQQQNETEQLQAQAALTGFKGIGRIQAQGDVDISKVNADPSLDEETKQQRVAAIHTRVNLEILNAEQQFTDQVDALADERSQHALTGFAKIEAAARSAIEVRRKAFEDQYSQVDRSTPQGAAIYQQGLNDFNREKAAIQAGAIQDRTELARQNSEETAQLELTARMKSLTAEKQATAAIQAEYEARTSKYSEELQRQEISQDDYDRRIVAAAKLRDAEITEAARQARERMASQFSRFFQNPTNALKEFGDRAAGEAAASLVQQLEGKFSSSGSTRVTGGFDHLVGTIFGGKQATPSNDRRAEGRERSNASTGILSIATARIQIGSAVIAGGGGASTAVPANLLSSGAELPSAGGEAGAAGGAAGGSAASSTSEASSTSAPGSIASSGTSLLSTASSGIKLGQSALGLFSKSGSSSSTLETTPDILNGKLNADGSFTSGSTSAFSKSVAGGGGLLNNVSGIAGGGLGLFSAYEGNGGVGGMLSGALSGAKLGMSLGGPIGAGIGAAAGAALGAFGFGGREQARVYDLKTVRPRIGNDFQSFRRGAMDYLSAYSDLESLDSEAKKTTNKMGPAAQRYYQDTIKSEIRQAEGRLSAEQRAGRSQFTFSAAQFATGTDSVPGTGWAIIHDRERIIPSDKNERITRALEAGASADSIYRGYRDAMRARDARPTASTGDRSLTMNVHAWDSRDVARFFDMHKHTMRAALNSSYGENSGGADA